MLIDQNIMLFQIPDRPPVGLRMPALLGRSLESPKSISDFLRKPIANWESLFGGQFFSFCYVAVLTGGLTFASLSGLQIEYGSFLGSAFWVIGVLVLALCAMPIIYAVIYLCLLGVLLFFLPVVFVKAAAEQETIFQGTWVNGLTAIIFGAWAGLLVASLFVAVEQSFMAVSEPSTIRLVILFSFAGLFFGGLKGLLQHYLLRAALVATGSVPWALKRFLDYATDEIEILQRVGRGYEFRHEVFQEALKSGYSITNEST